MSGLLSAKKEAFCQNYAIGETRNKGKASALKAGYAQSSAATTASNLLKNPQIKARLDEIKGEQFQRLEITSDKILNEIARIAFADTTDIIDLMGGKVTIEDFHNLTPEQRACIQSVKQTPNGIELKLYDKLAALEKLGRHKKLFTDVQEQKHSFTKMGAVEIIDESGQRVALEFDIGQEPIEHV